MENASSSVMLVLVVFYFIVSLVVYHKMFTVYYLDLGKGIGKEIITALFVSLVLTGFTLYLWPVAVIVIILIGLGFYAKNKNVVVLGAFAVLGIIVAVVGHGFKSDVIKKHNEKAEAEAATAYETDSIYNTQGVNIVKGNSQTIMETGTINDYVHIDLSDIATKVTEEKQNDTKAIAGWIADKYGMSFLNDGLWYNPYVTYNGEVSVGYRPNDDKNCYYPNLYFCRSDDANHIVYEFNGLHPGISIAKAESLLESMGATQVEFKKFRSKDIYYSYVYDDYSDIILLHTDSYDSKIATEIEIIMLCDDFAYSENGFDPVTYIPLKGDGSLTDDEVETEMSETGAADNPNDYGNQTQENINEWMIEGSDSRYINKDEIEYMSKEDLRIARNEIYARHGRMFTSTDLQQYFDNQVWYSGTTPADQFDEACLNDYEKKNLDLIKTVEEETDSSSAGQNTDDEDELTGTYVAYNQITNRTITITIPPEGMLHYSETGTDYNFEYDFDYGLDVNTLSIYDPSNSIYYNLLTIEPDGNLSYVDYGEDGPFTVWFEKQ